MCDGNANFATGICRDITWGNLLLPNHSATTPVYQAVHVGQDINTVRENWHGECAAACPGHEALAVLQARENVPTFIGTCRRADGTVPDLSETNPRFDAKYTILPAPTSTQTVDKRQIVVITRSGPTSTPVVEKSVEKRQIVVISRSVPTSTPVVEKPVEKRQIVVITRSVPSPTPVVEKRQIIVITRSVPTTTSVPLVRRSHLASPELKR